MLYRPNPPPPPVSIPALRHRCRNVRCGAKLGHPTDNLRDAFCCSGCATSYFRNRCLVCERAFERKRKAEHQRFCRPKCRKEFQRHPERFLGGWGDVLVSSRATSETPIKGPGFSPTKVGRPFAQVAGPELSPTEFRLATLPLDPEFAARLERAHRTYTESRAKAKRAAERKALIKRRTPPVNILGGYKFPGAPVVDLDPPEWAIPSRWKPVDAGADVPPIPDFLLRVPATSTPTVAAKEPSPCTATAPIRVGVERLVRHRKQSVSTQRRRSAMGGAVRFGEEA